MEQSIINLIENDDVVLICGYVHYFNKHKYFTFKMIKFAAVNNKLNVFKYLTNILLNYFGIGVDYILATIVTENVSIESINYLLKIGADINAGDNRILSTVVKSNNCELAKYLISVGADVNNYYQHFLLNAIENNNLKMVKLLVEKSVNPKNNYARIIESFAYINKRYDILKYLLTHCSKCVSFYIDISDQRDDHVNFLKFVFGSDLIDQKQFLTEATIRELYDKKSFDLLYEIFKNYEVYDGTSIVNLNIKSAVVKKHKELLFNKIYENNFKKDILFVMNS